MSPDDTSDDEGEEIEVVTDSESAEDDGKVRDRLEQEADRAVEQFDERLVDLLAWLLDTETRARIYVNLRQHPHSTSEEIADGTGLYPSTVREALAELHDEGTLTRRKRESDGAGNNPYEYSAIAPSELVSDAVGDVQSQLNTLFNLDSYLSPDDDVDETSEPVTISVEDADEDE
ncbi:MAG: helix-turn-helix domain-containing protein [Halapricum sp.]